MEEPTTPLVSTEDHAPVASPEEGEPPVFTEDREPLVFTGDYERYRRRHGDLDLSAEYLQDAGGCWVFAREQYWALHWITRLSEQCELPTASLMVHNGPHITPATQLPFPLCTSPCTSAAFGPTTHMPIELSMPEFESQLDDLYYACLYYDLLVRAKFGSVPVDTYTAFLLKFNRREALEKIMEGVSDQIDDLLEGDRFAHWEEAHRSERAAMITSISSKVHGFAALIERTFQQTLRDLEQLRRQQHIAEWPASRHGNTFRNSTSASSGMPNATQAAPAPHDDSVTVLPAHGFDSQPQRSFLIPGNRHPSIRGPW